jgi:hypothetical protein
MYTYIHNILAHMAKLQRGRASRTEMVFVGYDMYIYTLYTHIHIDSHGQVLKMADEYKIEVVNVGCETYIHTCEHIHTHTNTHTKDTYTRI